MTKQLNFPAGAMQQLAEMVSNIDTPSTPRSLAIASAVLGEGVTTTAAAFAGFLTHEHQLKVLLIDANLRSPAQHALFGVPLVPGLSESLRDDRDWRALVHAGDERNPSVISAGTDLDHPDRYLKVAKLKEQIDQLGAEFDWVIVDCPPVNAYPDAPLIAASCTVSVIVVRSGRTRREIVEEAKRRLSQTGANVVGVVLNRRRYYIPAWLYRWI